MCSGVSAANAAWRSWLNRFKRLQDGRHERRNIRQAIRPGDDNQDGNRQCRTVLLEFDPAFCRQENIEVGRCHKQQATILDSGPTSLLNACNVMPSQQRTQPGRDGLVKQNAH